MRMASEGAPPSVSRARERARPEAVDAHHGYAAAPIYPLGDPLTFCRERDTPSGSPYGSGMGLARLMLDLRALCSQDEALDWASTELRERHIHGWERLSLHTTEPTGSGAIRRFTFHLLDRGSRHSGTEGHQLQPPLGTAERARTHSRSQTYPGRSAHRHDQTDPHRPRRRHPLLARCQRRIPRAPDSPAVSPGDLHRTPLTARLPKALPVDSRRMPRGICGS